MLVILLLAACVASPPIGPDESVTTARVPEAAVNPAEFIRLEMESTLPLLAGNGDDRDALLASDFSIGIDDDLLLYRATYSLEGGDIVASTDAGAVRAASLTHFGTQHFGQDIELGLAELAGAPLTLGLSSEFGNSWMVSGYTEYRREQANLNWSPGPATLDVKWAGNVPAAETATALACDVRSTVKLPTHEGAGHAESLRLTGRKCVIGDESWFAGIEAHTWGLGYLWSRAGRESEALLSVVDPQWAQGLGNQDPGPGYRLDFRHLREFGPFSASALVSLRQPPAWENAAEVYPVDKYIGTTGTSWATDASLTWNLPDASLSANWATGVDRLWFTPEPGQRTESFGLALNLSRWIETFTPYASPEFAMQWNWSRMTLPTGQQTGSNALSLDMALMF